MTTVSKVALTYLRIDLKYFSDDVFLIFRIFENDRKNGDSKVVQHLKSRQEIVDVFNVLKIKNSTIFFETNIIIKMKSWVQLSTS